MYVFAIGHSPLDAALAVKTGVPIPAVDPVFMVQYANGSPTGVKRELEWKDTSMKEEERPHRRPKVAPKPFDPSPSTNSSSKKRRVRCMECPACLRLEDCGVCSNCKWVGLGGIRGGAR